MCDACGKSWPADHTHCPNDGCLLQDTIVESRLSQQWSVGEISFTPDVLEATFNESITPILAYSPPEWSEHELPAGARVGDYEIIEQAGEGSMGIIYRAEHVTIHKQVAIKVLSPDLVEDGDAVLRFAEEARAVAMLDHPNIVHVFGFGRLTDGRSYIAMEWLDGYTLQERLAIGRLPFELALEITRQIARGLQASHAKRIVHRDLKPENIFLQDYGEDDDVVVKLVDFGLAKVVKQGKLFTQTTRDGMLIGTPKYMSPEQCKAQRVDHRADIYSLGCVCYEMMCGRVPFVQRSAPALIAAHVQDRPPRPRSLVPTLPDELDDLLYRMVAKNPDDRPSLTEVRQAIATMLGFPTQSFVKLPARSLSGRAPRMPAATNPGVAPAGSRSRHAFVILICALVTAALASVALFLLAA